MKPRKLLFSSEGRIGRSEFLLGGCALIGGGIVVQKALVIIVGGLAFLMTRGHGSTGNQAFGGLMFGLSSLVNMYFTPLYLLLCLYPLYRLVGKRCRDRNRAFWLAIVYTAALIVPTITMAIGFFLRGFIGKGAADFLGNNIVQLVIACLALTALVDLVVLRGQGQAEPISPLPGPVPDR